VKTVQHDGERESPRHPRLPTLLDLPQAVARFIQWIGSSELALSR
jgi:hypothetical protein